MKILFRFSIIAVVFLSAGCATASDLRDFTSDGCSLFPDGTSEDRQKWCNCCFKHDIAYWQGGTSEERKQADMALRDCVLERTGNKVLANVMYDGVRVGGSPVFPAWYRWGYGWPYGREYKPLSESEQQEVKAKLDAYRKGHPSGYCGEAKPVKQKVKQ